MIPGEYLFDGPELEINLGRPTVKISVKNTGDRPIQVGSHFHFFEANRALEFDRRAGLRHAARHPGRHRRAVRAGRLKERATSCLWAASATSSGSTAWSTVCRRTGPKPTSAEPDLRDAESATTRPSPTRSNHPGTSPRCRRSQPAVRRPLRPDRRRPHPPGRHRSDHRDRERLRRLRRRGRLRRRQDDSRRHGPVAAAARRRRRPPRLGHHQRRRPRLLGHREGRHRHPRRPDRRHRQGRQPADPGRRRPRRWSSARAPRSSPARA